MDNLRNELMHYTNDLSDGVDLKAEAVAAIEQIAQYMTKEALFHHSRPLALAYLALTEEVDSVTVTRCKDCKHFKHYGKTSLLIDGEHIKAGWCYRRVRYNEEYRMPSDGFCSYGERKDDADG